MNIFITGGAGFIGSNVAAYHHKKGDKIWILDNLSAGKTDNISFHVERFDRDDLRYYRALKEALEWADIVYHLAATVGQSVILKNPTAGFLNNLQSTEKLFQEAKPHNRILFASSASVYWDGVIETSLLQEEATLKLKLDSAPLQAYRLSKLCGEELAQLSGRNVVIARLFNIYGSSQRSFYGSVIPRWIEQCRKEEPLTIYGDGNQKRSFCYITDAVEAMAELLEQDRKNAEIYDVGIEETISLLQLSQIIREVMRKDPGIIHIPYEKAYGISFREAENIVPKFTKLHRTIRFRPSISIREGIARIAK